MPKAEREKVFAAAVVSYQFKGQLVNPETSEKALNDEYLGKPFNLNEEDKKAFVESTADNLTDLAKDVKNFFK